MTVYLGETWSRCYDSQEGSWDVSKVFLDKGLAYKWANQPDENRTVDEYDVESPQIPIMPGDEVVDGKSLRKLGIIPSRTLY